MTDTDSTGTDSTGMAASGVATRLYVDAPLKAGAELALDGDRAHYLKQVLRLGPGDAVGLFNGRDGEWRARIEEVARRGVRLRAEAQTRPQAPDADLWLVFAPIKRQRIDLVAEKASELGAAAIWPVFTERTVMTRVNLERLRANAIEAAEQTERLSVPEIREPVTLGELAHRWPKERRLLLCAEAGDARPIASVLQEILRERGDAIGPAAILVGPEGGFASAELDALGKLPFVTAVGLGPRILRADTAAVAALACWQAIVGDGARRPPQR
jgi:16S rRNA (uracil1498-N3)-methyltransferase